MHRVGTIRAVYLPGVTGKASSVTYVAVVTHPVDLLVERAMHNPRFLEGLRAALRLLKSVPGSVDGVADPDASREADIWRAR